MNTIAAAMRLCNGQPLTPPPTTHEARQAAREWHEWKQQERRRQALELKIERDEGTALWDDARLDDWVVATASSSSRSSWETASTQGEEEEKEGCRSGEEEKDTLMERARPFMDALLLEVRIAALKRRARIVGARIDGDEQDERCGPVDKAMAEVLPVKRDVHCYQLRVFGDQEDFAASLLPETTPPSAAVDKSICVLDLAQSILNFVLLLFIELLKLILLPIAFVLTQVAQFLRAFHEQLDALGHMVQGLLMATDGRRCVTHGLRL